MPESTLIAEFLRVERKRQGLTLQDLAAMLGASGHSVICNWEAGRSMPNFETLTAWAAALGFDVGLFPTGGGNAVAAFVRERLAVDQASEISYLPGQSATKPWPTSGRTPAWRCRSVEARGRGT